MLQLRLLTWTSSYTQGQSHRSQAKDRAGEGNDIDFKGIRPALVDEPSLMPLDAEKGEWTVVTLLE